MRKISFLLFTLLALLYVTNANALIVNDTFTRDGNTYRGYSDDSRDSARHY